MSCWHGCLEPGANDLHIVHLMPLPLVISCFIKIHIGLTFLVSAYPGCHGKEPIKWVFVCLAGKTLPVGDAAWLNAGRLFSARLALATSDVLPICSCATSAS